MRQFIFLVLSMYYYKYYKRFLLYLLSFTRYTLKDVLLSIPYLKQTIKKKLIIESKNLHKSLQTSYLHINEIPEKQLQLTNIKDKINNMKQIPNSNKISGIVYLGDKQHNENMLEIFKQFSFSNPLHPDLYPQIRDMEIDIINMIKELYKGDQTCCGNVTYGGTESILLACVTYRNYYRHKKGITKPNIVCFQTIHPAFDKAGHYFGIQLIKVNTINEIKSNINSNTISLVGSCPEYAYGTVDPIKELSKLAIKKNISLHVDCCMGSLLVPFLDEYKHINFTLPGITSISCDTHKYGYSLKGSSVLLFKNYQFKKYQHYINKDWKGGVYATPTIMGSKSGGLISATWASLLLIGKEQYRLYAQQIQKNLQFIRESFIHYKDILIIGKPNINIIAFKSIKLDIYQIVNVMKQEYHWDLTVMQNPASFHICLTKIHSNELCKLFVENLRESLEKSRNKKKLSGTLALYGSSSKLENSLFIDEIVHDYIFLLSSNNCIQRYEHL